VTPGSGSIKNPRPFDFSSSSGSSNSGSSHGSLTCIDRASSLFVTGISFIFGKVCGVRPRFTRGNQGHPTFGLACEKELEASEGSSSTSASSTYSASSVFSKGPGMCIVAVVHREFSALAKGVVIGRKRSALHDPFVGHIV
jgi:hypothetical protein